MPRQSGPGSNFRYKLLILHRIIAFPDSQNHFKTFQIISKSNNRAELAEISILDHAFVATPHVVHQDVDRVRLANDKVERRFHLDIESMVAADARELLIEALVIRR